MKKQILNLAAVALVGGSLMLTSCSKDDTTAPIITLNGLETVTATLEAPYVDAGATAEDDEDGDLTSQITVENPVNINQAGTYIVKYSVTDAAGNVATAERTVNVENSAAYLVGSYSVTETGAGSTYTYTQTITADPNKNGRIRFNKFGDYANNSNIYAEVSGVSITVPSQVGISIGTNNGGSCDVASHTFAGTGTVTSSTAPVTFEINVSDQLTSPSSCSGAATNYKQVYTKQ